jgi:hypothetical protein
MNPTDVAWAAGLFEGEGSVIMTSARVGKTPKLALSMTDEDVVRRFYQKVGLGHVNGPYIRTDGTKPQWAWNVTSFEKVQALIAQWWPWLGSRRRARATEVLLAARLAPIKAAHRMRCPQGHPYSGANVIVVTRRSNDRNRAGKQIRLCRTCSYANTRRYRTAKRTDVRQLPLDQSPSA